MMDLQNIDLKDKSIIELETIIKKLQLENKKLYLNITKKKYLLKILESNLDK